MLMKITAGNKICAFKARRTCGDLLKLVLREMVVSDQ